MIKEIFPLFILIISPVILMILHIIFIRLQNSLNINISRQLSLIMIAAILNIPTLSVICMLDKNLSTLIYSFIVFNCLSYSYFHFFNLSETARRMRILTKIKQLGSISCNELSEVYKSESMVLNRLHRLAGLGQIRQQENGNYVLSGKILWLSAVIIVGLRKIFGFK